MLFTKSFIRYISSKYTIFIPKSVYRMYDVIV